MGHSETPAILGVLVLMLAAAKACGLLAKWTGQPSVLGELVAGIVLGTSVLGLVDAKDEKLHLLAQIGVVILLFEIGLETDLRKLARVAGAATTVAVTGLVVPFALGYGTCRLLGLDAIVSLVLGATVAVTGVGVTARMLRDLGRLDDAESQIALGAAVIDDSAGLVVLAVVEKLASGQTVTTAAVAWLTVVAFGFLIGTLLLGSRVVPPLLAVLSRVDPPGSPTILAMLLAFGLGWTAHLCGSSLIVGAFAAGLLLRRTPQAARIGQGVSHLGYLFVPLFFVQVGAAVDLGVFHPAVAANRTMLLVAGLLIVVAVVGKFAAGYAAFWFPGRKGAIGAAMVPRGAVGLVFAQVGLTSGVLDVGLFSAATVMVIVTTLVAAPLLRLFLPPRRRALPPPAGVAELVTEP